MEKTANSIFLFSKTPYKDVHHIPILHIRYLQPKIDFSAYDYIIATSKEVLIALDGIGNWKMLPVLAISDATAEYARKLGARILDVAEGYAENILRLIKDKYPGYKALYAHAKVTAYDLEEALSGLPVRIDSFVVYETECAKKIKVELPVDAVCIFTSPSAVQCFMALYGFLPSYKIVCIGETTRASLPIGIEAVVAEKTSLESAVECAKKVIA